MERFKVVQKLIDKYGYKRYLEVGSERKLCFNRINCEHKESVDIKHEADYKMSSDEFFKTYKGPKFDIVYVDANHNGDYAFRDACNSLNILEAKGCLVMHDCKPWNELSQMRFDYPGVGGRWNGSVWRAWLLLRPHIVSYGYKADMYVVNSDHGVGVIDLNIYKEIESIAIHSAIMEYVDFKKREKELLNLISVDDFLRKCETKS